MAKDYFGVKEFYDKSKMFKPFLDRLNGFREDLGKKVFLTSSNSPAQKHVATSDHPGGYAVDFTTEENSPRRVYELMVKHGFGGIGLYRTADRRYYYHCAFGGKDISDKWLGYVDAKGNIKYKALDEKVLKKFFGEEV